MNEWKDSQDHVLNVFESSKGGIASVKHKDSSISRIFLNSDCLSMKCRKVHDLFFAVFES